MKRRAAVSVVLVTAPSLQVARKLAKAALQQRLAACANLIPRLESHYWWQGRLNRDSEVLLIFKTTTSHLEALEKLIISKHPYDTPEFIALRLSTGNRRYLDWVANSIQS
jgi:periplasmic divalent cation tolerance protein